MRHERFLSAAQGVLDGDDSKNAANALERIVLDDYLGDERFDQLEEVLSLYAPGEGSPYTDGEELRLAIRQTIASFE